MGLVMILIYAGMLIVVGGPCAVLGLVALLKSPRQPPFRAACVGTALASAAALYGAMTAPMVWRGESSWELFTAPMLGFHLAVPVVGAALLWFVPRGPRAPAIGGAVAGLLFSVPLEIGLSLPLGFLVPAVFQMRFVP